MNIPLFFISIFLIATLFLSPIGIILLIVSFKLGNKGSAFEQEYEKLSNVKRKCIQKEYDEKMLEDLR